MYLKFLDKRQEWNIRNNEHQTIDEPSKKKQMIGEFPWWIYPSCLVNMDETPLWYAQWWDSDTSGISTKIEQFREPNGITRDMNGWSYKECPKR